MAIEKDIVINVKENGVDELQSKVLKLDNSLGELDDTNKNLSKTMDGTQQSVLDNGGAMGLLNDATGGLAMTVKDAIEASALFAKQSKIGMAVQKAYTFVMGTSSGALKVFKLALIGTGIGAIVIALVMLIANFGKVKDAVMNLIPGLKKVGDFFGKIIDAVTDFVGVTSDATRELKRLGEEADATIKRNTEALELYGDNYDQYTKRKIEANTAYAKKYKEFQDQEGGITKENLEYLKKLRIKYNNDILKADQDREEAAAQKRKEASDKAAEDRQKERDRIQNEKDNPRKKVVNIVTEIIDPNKELLSKQLLGQQLILEDKRIQHQMAINAKEIAAENADEILAKETLLKEGKIELANQTLNIIGMLAKKGSKVAKGVAAAQALMNTYQGITAALAAVYPAGPVGFALKIANAASVGIMGLMNVKNILKADETGASAGGGATVQAPTAPSFNLVQGTNSNQITEGIKSQSQPVKAYVVSSDVSTGQEMDRKIIAGASL